MIRMRPVVLSCACQRQASGSVCPFWPHIAVSLLRFPCRLSREGQPIRTRRRESLGFELVSTFREHAQTSSALMSHTPLCHTPLCVTPPPSCPKKPRLRRYVVAAGLRCHLDDACIHNPCHGCDTSPVDGRRVCDCPPGFTGINCDQDVNECQESTCCVHRSRSYGSLRFCTEAPCASRTDNSDRLRWPLLSQVRIRIYGLF